MLSSLSLGRVASVETYEVVVRFVLRLEFADEATTYIDDLVWGAADEPLDWEILEIEEV